MTVPLCHFNADVGRKSCTITLSPQANLRTLEPVLLGLGTSCCFTWLAMFGEVIAKCVQGALANIRCAGW